MTDTFTTGHGADHPDQAAVAKLGDIAASAGLRRVHMLAWRDLADVEAGGSEIHAAAIAKLWAAAGIEVTMRTSYAQGHLPTEVRDGYKVVRRAGRYLIFPRAALAELRGAMGPRDGLVEIWNGMPFFSPLWAAGPRITFLHHVHAEMWQMALPPNLAKVGDLIERRLAPPLYRRTRVVTLSESSKRELVEQLGFRPERVSVVHPGIDPRFSPGGTRSPRPLVVAVGRLVAVKRFHLLVDALVALKPRHPDLRAVIVGDGYERGALREQIAANDADGWIALAGRVDDAALIDLYRSAWVLASTSAREGWGMTLTEAAACGTPSVVTRIAGHEDAVDEGRSGLLAGDLPGIVAALDRVLGDADLRRRLQEGALAHARRFTWEATARGTLEALAEEAHRHARGRHRPG
ncbi:MAG TPA: glycosyltransferase family 4 protein [Acidimicrobiales bacterium]|jgi:glycosyltransferase involved in cell wall biosynthesis